MNGDKKLVIKRILPEWLKIWQLLLIVLMFSSYIFLLINHISDYNDWEKAAQIQTIESYQEYVNSHPNGRYVRLANSKIINITHRILEENRKKEEESAKNDKEKEYENKLIRTIKDYDRDIRNSSSSSERRVLQRLKSDAEHELKILRRVNGQ